MATGAAHSYVAWRRMREGDLPAVLAIAAMSHSGHPEEDAVFAERLRLCPAGCFVLDRGAHAAGYALSHPWVLGSPPRLNSLLGALPGRPMTLHLHDVALLPAERGAGATSQLVGRLAELARAEGLPDLSLVAIAGLAAFWERQGFRTVQDPALQRDLHSYDAAAQLMKRSVS